MVAVRRAGWAMLLGWAGWVPPATAQSAPADSTLAAACAGGESGAEGLLVVVFRADVPPERRAAMAGEVGGRLGGPATDAEPDGYYVTLPPEGRAALDAAADRLIRLDGVESVGGVACPPPPAPVGSTAPADSAAPAAPAVPPPVTPPPADTAAIR